MIPQIPKDSGHIIRAMMRGLMIRFARRRVATPEALAHFVETRAAYVAQTSLYGYIKTRMGTRYVKMFEDEVFARSINFAKWRVYAACLSDLAVFSAATAAREGGLNQEETEQLARFCFAHAKQNAFAGEDLGELSKDSDEAFSARLGWVKWDEAGDGEKAFSASPQALIKWAPIAENLKAMDQEIVSNSIRFRWRDVRDQLRKRIDAQAVCALWQHDGARAHDGPGR